MKKGLILVRNLALIAVVIGIACVSPKPASGQSYVPQAIIFSDDFSTDQGWTDASAGNIYRDLIQQNLVWKVGRAYNRTYYHPIAAAADNVRVRFRFQVNSANGNGSVFIGLVENLTGATLTGFPTGFFIVPATWKGNSVKPVFTSITYSDRPTGGGWNENDPSTFIDFGSFNTWHGIEVNIQQTNWSLEMFDGNWVSIKKIQGIMPANHSHYNYFLIGENYLGGFETESGLLDDVEISTDESITPVASNITVINNLEDEYPCGPTMTIGLIGQASTPPLVDSQVNFTITHPELVQEVYVVADNVPKHYYTLAEISTGVPGQYSLNITVSDIEAELASMWDSVITILMAIAGPAAETFMIPTNALLSLGAVDIYGYIKEVVLVTQGGVEYPYSPNGSLPLRTIYDLTWRGNWNPGGTLHPRCSMTIAYMRSPVDILVTDTQGRRTGKYDGQALAEIPGSYYSGPSSEPEYVVIFSPAPGSQFTADLVGTGTGTYTFVFGQISPTPGQTEAQVFKDVPVIIGDKRTITFTTPLLKIYLPLVMH